MTIFDVKKEQKHLYAPARGTFSFVDVPEARYLAVDGAGNPNTVAAYAHAVQALYSVSYTLKFFSKNELEKNYVVGPLEGLWWADDFSAFVDRNKDLWKWSMMIRQPEWITQEMYDAAIAKNATKPLPALPLVREEKITEGRCVQIMHIGSYDDEAPVLATLHNEFMPQHQLTFNGKHHEIYLSDPRKTPAEKLKTILRQPVKSSEE